MLFRSLRGTYIPQGVNVTVTRNYGVTANAKAHKLIEKLIFATASVVLLVLITMGRREAAIVGAAVAVTLAATLFASWAWGFTINRVSLFALIFSIGILVDDAIVIVENVHRHVHLGGGKLGKLGELIPARRGRGRGADDPRDVYRDCRPSTDGLRERVDGTVYEPDPYQRQHGDAHLPRDGAHLHALALQEAPQSSQTSESGAP